MACVVAPHLCEICCPKPAASADVAEAAPGRHSRQLTMAGVAPALHVIFRSDEEPPIVPGDRSLHGAINSAIHLTRGNRYAEIRVMICATMRVTMRATIRATMRANMRHGMCDCRSRMQPRGRKQRSAVGGRGTPNTAP